VTQRAGRVAKLVEYLGNKHKALSSKPNLTKEKIMNTHLRDSSQPLSKPVDAASHLAVFTGIQQNKKLIFRVKFRNTCPIDL
jgi:hypothetical protein